MRGPGFAMRRVTLLNLETLCCIARLGTFHAAAQQMHASQPAISARVRDMEKALGTPLFTRLGGRTELTCQGRELVQLVEPLLRRLDSVVEGFSLDGPRVAAGTVRIAADELVALTWFGGFIARLRAALPNVTCHVEVASCATMAQRLRDGKLDVAIASGLAGCAAETLGLVRMRWMVAPALKAQSAAHTTARELLASHAVWTLPPPSASHALTMDALHALGVAPHSLASCDHTMALIALVAGGAGAALLPEVLVASRIARSELVMLPELAAAEMAIRLACREGAGNEPAVRTAIELARRHALFGTPGHGTAAGRGGMAAALAETIN